jgi:protein phosphatase
MKFFGLTDKGKVRKDNQDSFATEKLGRASLCAVVCDGMGGANAGSIASSTAVEAFAGTVKAQVDGGAELDAAVTEAAKAANTRVYERSISDSECRGMGTTLVGVAIKAKKTVVFNVGDSRAYLISDGKISRVTSDHSLVQELVRSGEISAEQARTHPRKNIITRAVGIAPEVKCDIFTPELKIGDMMLICSDGLSNVLRDEEMLDIYKKNHDVRAFCRALMKAALAGGAPDNVTVVAVLR